MFSARLLQKIDGWRNNYHVVKGRRKLVQAPFIIGLIRERNETLLLQDTLDHLSQFVDGIVVFDDASTDNSVAIAKSHPMVLEVIINEVWQRDRAKEETRNRSVLLESARKYKSEWFMYCDADERFEGDIKQYLTSTEAAHIDGVRISLFDAYITRDDQAPYTGGELYGFRKKFGPERRDIIMLWRNTPTIHYTGVDAREPYGLDESRVVTKFYCQHFGKAISIEQWEETCQYYSKYFPMYSAKWEARKGKAVHTVSDFDRPLYDWNMVKKKAVKIHPA